MKKRFVIPIAFAIICLSAVIIPIIYKEDFAFKLHYTVDNNEYLPNMYTISSNQQFAEKNQRYVFENVERGIYQIKIESVMDDKSKVVINFFNSQVCDVYPTDIHMDITVNIATKTDKAMIEIRESNSNKFDSYILEINENGEYCVDFSNC